MKILRAIILIVIALNFNYIYKYQLSTVFGYEGFKMETPSAYKIMVIWVLIIILIFATFIIKSSYYLLIYSIWLTLLFFGQAIYDLYNNTWLCLYLLIPTILLILVGIKSKKYSLKRSTIDINNKKFAFFALLIALLLIMPYMNNITNINIKNLLLIDIYETREQDFSNKNILLDYLFSSVARVIFPFLFIYYISKRNYLYASIIFILILLMFLLNGAVKSILFGIILCIFFYFFTYKGKNNGYLITVAILSSLSNILFFLNGNYQITDYLRRVFFSPSNLFNVYSEQFSYSHTYFMHSRIAKIFGIQMFDGSLARYVGENIIGKEGLIANVGIFVEGFISFGIIGVIIASFIFTFIIALYNFLNFHEKYFGIFFAYIYIINTSFLETLFITHGLVMLFILGYYFIPSNKIKKDLIV